MATAWARAVLELQKADRKIQDCKTRLSLLPKERLRIAAAKKAIDDRLNKFRDAVKSSELEMRAAESEIATLESTIEKNKQQSSLIKKNTEYQAMLGAIDMAKTQIGKLETKVLGCLDNIEKQKASLERQTRLAQAEIKTLKAEWLEFDDVEKSVKTDGAAMIAERKKLLASLPASLAEEYENLMKGNDGVPLVAIEEGVCGHCFLKVTPQTINRALTGAVVNCENCRHLLYLPEVQ